MKSRSLMERTSARTRRATPIQPVRPMMIMMYQMDGSSMAITARIRKKVGKAEHDIDETHQDAVDPAAVITRRPGRPRCRWHGDADCDKADLEGDPGAVDDPGEDISPQFIGAEPVVGDGGSRTW